MARDPTRAKSMKGRWSSWCGFVSLAFLIPLGATSAKADVVTDWNTAALNAIRIDRTPPPRASRALAILHVSVYDAVNGISRTNETYFVQSKVPASAST